MVKPTTAWIKHTSGFLFIFELPGKSCYRFRICEFLLIHLVPSDYLWGPGISGSCLLDDTAAEKESSMELQKGSI
jgi:hypothetical protein